MPTVKTNAPKAYSYLRFSTPEQMRGDSFRRQTELATRYARENGLQLDETVTLNDLGVSAYRGRNAKKGALRLFLDAVEQEIIPEGSFLLVESLDRMSREQVTDALGTFLMIINSGIVLVTLTDRQQYSKQSIGANPYQMFISLGTMIRANEESAMKGRRVKAAWDAKRSRAASEPLTSRGPAWLMLDRETNEWGVIPGRKRIVRRIYSMTLKGIGQHAIADTLNREGVEVFGDGSRKGKFWHRSYIVKILESPAVVGTFTPHVIAYDGPKKRRVPQSPVPGYFPAVVEQSIFDRVQAQKAVPSPKRGRHASTAVQNILGGLARCPLCDATMTRVNKGRKGGKPMLVCTRAKTGAGCTYHSVPVEYVETALVERAEELVQKAPAGARAEEIDGALADMADRMLALEEIASNLLNEIGNSPSHRIRERLREIEGEIDQARGERDTLLRQKAQAVGDVIEHKLGRMMQSLSADPLNRDEANQRLRELFSAVVVDWKRGVLTCRWHHGGESEVRYGWPDKVD